MKASIAVLAVLLAGCAIPLVRSNDGSTVVVEYSRDFDGLKEARNAAEKSCQSAGKKLGEALADVQVRPDLPAYSSARVVTYRCV